MAIGNEGKHTGNIVDRLLVDAIVDAQLTHRQDGLHGEDHPVGARVVIVARTTSWTKAFGMNLLWLT